MGADTRIDVIPDAWRRRLRRAVRPVLVVVAAGALLGTGAALAQSQLEATPVAAAEPRTVWLSGSSLSYAHAQQAAQALGWQATAYSLPGAGISRGAHDPGATLMAAARRVLPLPDAPDVVVLQGGEADHMPGAEPLQVATERLLEQVRSATGPQTRVVLIGPIPGGTVPDSLRRVNAVLAQVATSQGVAYVDAIDLGWRAGDAAVPEQLAAALRQG